MRFACKVCEDSEVRALRLAQEFLQELALKVMSVTHHLLLLQGVAAWALALGLPGEWAPLGPWVSFLWELCPWLQLAGLCLASALV